MGTHFASSNITTGLTGEFGPAAVYQVVDSATTHTALTNQLVFTCARAGFYRITACLHVMVVGTGATQTWDMDLTVDNGTAQSAVANFVAAVDALTQYAVKTSISPMYYLPVGGTVKISTNSNPTETTRPKLAVGVIVEYV
jgi:hypothetical protein